MRWGKPVISGAALYLLADTPEGQARREARMREQMYGLLRETLVETAVAELGPMLDAAAGRVARREVDPYTASEQLVEAFRAGRR